MITYATAVSKNCSLVHSRTRGRDNESTGTPLLSSDVHLGLLASGEPVVRPSALRFWLVRCEDEASCDRVRGLLGGEGRASETAGALDTRARVFKRLSSCSTVMRIVVAGAAADTRALPRRPLAGLVRLVARVAPFRSRSGGVRRLLDVELAEDEGLG